MLNIENLNVSMGDKRILKNLSLKVGTGQVHAIMGPNGAGKSTLANVLAGLNQYEIDGRIDFLGEDLLPLTPEERAWKGVFLSFQYPVDIPGVSNVQFLKTALNAIRGKRGLDPLDAFDFLNLVKAKVASLNMSESLLYRSFNEGFSGGEKKSNEILQMSLLEPKLAILDETDSGLDIDALKTVAQGVEALRSAERTIIIITHYQRLLDYIEPDFVHVLADGQLVRSGDKKLAHLLEEKGYAWLADRASSS